MTTVIIPPPEDRTRIQHLLLEKIRIDADSTCWEWTDYIDPDTGYGRMRVPGENTTREAHSIAYEHFTEHGIPEDCQDLRHRCPRKSASCCNPHHLVPGTTAENQIDAILDGDRDVRFSANEIREIRRRYRETSITQADLGDEYGCSQRQISKIVRREDYTHIPPVESDDEDENQDSGENEDNQ